ncbi:MAG: DUF116 domain-containing protein, partial [Gammaproteobacteria bacterium]|nr:DUF116 domain-containing protein [Gammaproteobacteria bacterium]
AYAAALRFHRYRPTASLGAHQAVCHAVRADYCARRGIEIVRRVSGGGAVYLNPQQLCWSLAFRPRGPLAGAALTPLMETLCRALIAGLRRLGIGAEFQAPNDIEVQGRKIACGFLAARDDALLFQGSVLLDADTETLLKVLRAPTEKLSPQGIRSARERLVTLKDLLGYLPSLAALQHHLLAGLAAALEFEFEPAPGSSASLGADAPKRPVPTGNAPGLDQDWDRDEGALRAFLKTPGGVLHARIRLDPAARVVEELTLAGGVYLRPAQALVCLADELRGVALEDIERRCAGFFQRQAFDAIGFGPDDLGRVLKLALQRREQQAQLGLSAAQANTLMVHGAGGTASAPDILRRATVMLVPYCAKPAWCKWRYRDGCSECGLCEVGEAYRLARERDMRVISITHYEHLCRTLETLAGEQVPAYVGMCCSNFYLKRDVAFRQAGIPALLMDISGSNCYELQQEDQAYAGRFTAQSRLNLDVVERVMQYVPLPQRPARAGADEK